MNTNFNLIVNEAKKGNNLAFEALYNMTKDSSYFIAFSITKNEQDALDIMQDSYIKAFKGIETLNSPELFDNWIARIVSNTSKNYINKKKATLFADMGDNLPVEWDEELFNKDYIPHESIDTKETSRLLMQIIDKLSEDKRLCILMYYYQDMSVKEIAEALELPVSTVKYKLLSARAEIKKGVEDLENKGTKLYGLCPFVLFPGLFQNITTEFSKVHTVPEYSVLNLSAKTVSVEAATSKAVGAATKKGFFSTLAGKITVAILSVAIIGGAIFAVISALPKEDDSAEIAAVRIFTPEGFQAVSTAARNLHVSDFLDNNACYIWGKETEYGNVYYSFRRDRDGNKPAGSYELEDVPEMEDNHIQKCINEMFNYNVRKNKKIVDSEENKQYGDMEFINQKGTYQVKLNENKESKTLVYTAYYTIDDNAKNEEAPTHIFVFSNSNNDNIKLEIDRVAEEIINNSNWDPTY